MLKPNLIFSCLSYNTNNNKDNINIKTYEPLIVTFTLPCTNIYWVDYEGRYLESLSEHTRRRRRRRYHRQGLQQSNFFFPLFIAHQMKRTRHSLWFFNYSKFSVNMLIFLFIFFFFSLIFKQKPFWFLPN